MNETQKQNVQKILALAKEQIAIDKKNAEVGEAILIANREAQVEALFGLKLGE